MPKNVGDLGKLIVAKALKSCPRSNKSPNLVTLAEGEVERQTEMWCEGYDDNETLRGKAIQFRSKNILKIDF